MEASTHDQAPDYVMKPIDPYGHVAKAGQFVMIGGIAGVDPATDQLAGPGALAQARGEELPARTVEAP